MYNNSNPQHEEQCVFWLPCMAQDSYWILRSGSIYMQYETPEKGIFYHVHSNLKPGNHERPIEIDIRVTAYCDPNYVFDINTKDTDLFESTAEEISEAKFQYFADKGLTDTATDSSSKKEIKKIKKARKSIQKNNDELKLTLTLTDYHPTGLALFSITLTKQSAFYEKIKDTLYHQVKLHFHQHHYHSMLDNTAKPLYFYSKSLHVDLQTADNPASLHYIEKFHKIITQEIDTLYQDYRTIDPDTLNGKLNLPLTKRILFKAFRRIGYNPYRDNISKFYNNCYDLIGLGVFVQTLLNSRQNQACMIDNRASQLPPAAKKKFQTIASNLANSKAGAEALRNKVKHHHEDENLSIASRISWVSVALGILSVVLAILSFDSIKTPVYNYFHHAPQRPDRVSSPIPYLIDQPDSIDCINHPLPTQLPYLPANPFNLKTP